jgi:hypothetical protein
MGSNEVLEQLVEQLGTEISTTVARQVQGQLFDVLLELREVREDLARLEEKVDNLKRDPVPGAASQGIIHGFEKEWRGSHE